MCLNQVMIHEKFLYDRKTGEWTPDKYLQDLQDRFLIEKKQTTKNRKSKKLCNRYGGIDSVLLW